VGRDSAFDGLMNSRAGAGEQSRIRLMRFVVVVAGAGA
jgi:hypothetical protein